MPPSTSANRWMQRYGRPLGDHPLRLIRIDADAARRTVTAGMADVVDQIGGANLWQNDRYADLAAEPGAIVKASETSVAAAGASSGSPWIGCRCAPALAPMWLWRTSTCCAHSMCPSPDMLERLAKEKLRDRPQSAKRVNYSSSFRSRSGHRGASDASRQHTWWLLWSQPAHLQGGEGRCRRGAEFGAFASLSELGSAGQGLRLLMVSRRILNAGNWGSAGSFLNCANTGAA